MQQLFCRSPKACKTSLTFHLIEADMTDKTESRIYLHLFTSIYIYLECESCYLVVFILYMPSCIHNICTMHKTVSPLAVLDSCSQRLFSLAKTATDSVEDLECGVLHHGYQRRGHRERATNTETITLRNIKHFPPPLLKHRVRVTTYNRPPSFKHAVIALDKNISYIRACTVFA